MIVHFSEKFKSMADLREGYDRRSLVEDFFLIQYINNIDGCTSTKPELIDWYVTEFGQDQMKIFLNITNPVYVSSSEIPCQLKLVVTNRFLFQSLNTDVILKENFTTTVDMP